MKKDMDLARRIRGDAMKDHRDTMEKGANDMFFALPYSNNKDALSQLKKQVAKAK